MLNDYETPISHAILKAQHRSLKGDFIPHKKTKVLLSNHAVVALGILTRKAKKTVGHIKVSEILNDQEQAYALLAQSVIYGDQELVSLALELNQTLQISPNLIQALAAYTKDLANAPESIQVLAKQQQAISLLGDHLFDLDLHLKVYREASDAFLATANENEQPFYLNLIRGFHPYWEKTHHILLQALESKANKEQATIIKTWENLDNAFLTRIEESLLAAYTSAIHTIDIPDQQVVLRTKIAKLILIKQRTFDKTSEGYRENISTIKKSFSSHDLLTYFLSVSREFHQLWLDAQFVQVTPKI